MPQLLHPSFLGLGRRAGALLLALLAIAGFVVTGLVHPADASDPYVAGSDPTRVTRLGGGAAAAVLDRAVRHERIIGLTSPRARTVDRIVDRRGHRSYDEVTDLDARRPAGRRPALWARWPAHRRDPARLADRDRPRVDRRDRRGPGSRPTRSRARRRADRPGHRRAAWREWLVRPLGASRRRRAGPRRRPSGPALAGRLVPRAGVLGPPPGRATGVDDRGRLGRGRGRHPPRPLDPGQRPARGTDRRAPRSRGWPRTTRSKRLDRTRRRRSGAWPGSCRSARPARSRARSEASKCRSTPAMARSWAATSFGDVAVAVGPPCRARRLDGPGRRGDG